MRATTPAAAVIVTAAALLAPTVVDSPAEAAPCPAQMTFAVGGVGDQHAQHVPGLRGPVTRIHYSASIAPVGAVGGDTSRREGERKLDQAARAFRARCPQSTIIMQGNSLGAMIVTNVRDKYEHDQTMRRNLRVVAISDPRAPRGAASILMDFIPGMHLQGPRPKSTIPTSHTCRVSDAICDLGSVLQDPGHAINAAWGYLAGGQHGYRDSEVNQSPGTHMLPGEHVVPDTPLPWQPPTPREVLQPIAEVIVPDVPITDHYVPTPVREYIPKPIRQFVPKEIGDMVLPPVKMPW